MAVNAANLSFACATEILGFLAICFSWKSWSWIVLFNSLLDQFVGSFDCADGLSTFRFDAVWFIDFSVKTLIDGFNGLGIIILSLISQNPRSRFMLELMIILCHFWFLIRFARPQRFLAGLMMVLTIRLFFRDYFWWSGLLEYWIQIHTFVCSGSLVWQLWLFSPAWDAVKLIDPTDLGATTVVAPGLMLDNFLPIPDEESLPFQVYPLVLMLVVCAYGSSSGPGVLDSKSLHARHSTYLSLTLTRHQGWSPH